MAIFSKGIKWVLFLIVICVPAGQAWAAGYNIILKTSAGVSCGTGGFSFVKTTAGTFSVDANPPASVTSTSCAAPIPNALFTPGALNVVVQNITTPEPQGPNVVGLSGTLQFVKTTPGTCQGTGNAQPTKTYTITFAYGGTPNEANRTYSITCTGPGNFTTSGVYAVFNPASTVPEPETLLLLLTGMGALGLASWRFRKRRR